MSRKIAPFIDIVRLEDKETKLKSFVRTIVEQSTTACESSEQPRAVLLIARSIESPVAKAVAALVREGTITAPVKLILAILPRHEQPEGEGASETLSILLGASGGRMIRDIRLFDAHEQLVLGQAASWVGDCMRRDPMKRDAYECYASDCSKTAGWARTSFERLWNNCEPLPDDILSAGATHGPDVCAAVVAVDEAASDPLARSST